MKTKILLPFLLLTVNCLVIKIAKGQTVKDWYCPNINYNKVSFYMPDANTGDPTDATRIIYYTPKGVNYSIMNASLYQGQPIAIETTTVAFIGNDVKLLSNVVTNPNFTNKKTRYSPPLIIFKLPVKGHISTWVYKGERHSAEYSTIIVNGNQYNAIKVIEYQPRWHGETISYYVEGYGLIETDIINNNGETIISDKFNERNYNSEASSN